MYPAIKKHIALFFASILRLYTVYTPLKKGRKPLMRIEENLIVRYKNSVLAISRDNRKFLLKMPEDKPRLSIYTHGYCEKNLTRLFDSIIQEKDILFDIGANIGWYTTQFALRGKECHAFEPGPAVFERLVHNCKINAVDQKCQFNNYALGNEEGTVSFYNFKDLHHGLSSLSSFNRSDSEEIKVPISTLSNYINEKNIKKVDLIKVDVEGSEMNVLKGFLEHLNKGYQPIWTFELNDETSIAFDYKPSQLLTQLKNFGYHFFLVREKLVQLDHLEFYQNGDEVLCFIPEVHQERLGSLLPDI